MMTRETFTRISHRLNGVLVAMSAILATALLLVVVAVTPAHAYHYGTQGRYPGNVSPGVVQGSHIDLCAGLGYTCLKPWVYATGPVVYRSPASTGRQTVQVNYQLDRWNGSNWVVQSTKAYASYINPGYGSVRMPRVDFQPTSGRGYYRLGMAVAWGNSTGSVGYGSRALSFDEARDYVCNTRYACSVGAGWVYLS